MKPILSLLFLALIFSCSEKTVISQDPLDYISDTTTIAINRKTEPFTRTLQYLNGNLYWWNSDRETISVFDLSSQSLVNTIPLEREGPNALVNPLGFYAIDPDSIYIPTMAYEISLIDSQGKWMADYGYSNYSLLGITASMTRYSNMFQYNNAGILYMQLPSLRLLPRDEMNEEALKKHTPYLIFNINKGTYEVPSFRAPKSLLGYNDFIDLKFVSTPYSLLLLHAKSNQLFELDFNGVDFKEHTLQSDLIDNFSNEYYLADRRSMSIEENLRISSRTAKNFGLVHDPHKNLLYRYGWPGEDIPGDYDPMQFSATPPYFVISIYDDQDYRLLKEFTLPRNTYLAHHYFVDEKGLNLFPMHPENPDFNEDEMVIHTFDFGSLKE